MKCSRQFSLSWVCVLIPLCYAEFHQSKRLMSCNLLKIMVSGLPWLLETEQMMCQWSWKLILVLVSKVKKAHRHLVPVITPSENSNIWRCWLKFMEGTLTVESVSSFAIISTRTSSWCSANFTSYSRTASQAKCSSLTGYLPFTMLYGHHGHACSHSCLILTSDENWLLKIQSFSRLATTEHTSTSKCSGYTYQKLFSTVSCAITSL